MRRSTEPRLTHETISYSVALNDGSGLSLHYDSLMRGNRRDIDVILSDGNVESASLHLGFGKRGLTRFSLENPQVLEDAYQQVTGTANPPSIVLDTLRATEDYIDQRNVGSRVKEVRQRQEEKAGQRLSEIIDSVR